MTDANAWADLAREWLRLSSPRAARAMQEQDQEAARRRREWRSKESWRGARADREAEAYLERTEWAMEPEPVTPREQEIAAAREALEREIALAKARARARAERERGAQDRRGYPR
ncbi:hypothetical protein [Nonomuraea sp. NPDC023979]|uniref:hypothetical protein n=1 Tax=Nonomuraea sp. NPDC023979 TaxID=3154796 RepID=UPI0033F685CC